MRLTIYFNFLTPDIYIHDNTSDAKGVGAITMSPYVVNQTDYLNLDTQPSGTTVTQTADHLNVMSQGTAPSYKLHMVLHATINAQACQLPLSTTCLRLVASLGSLTAT